MRVRSLGNPCSAGLRLPPDRVSSGMVGAFALPQGSTLCNWLAESATPVLDVPPGTSGRFRRLLVLLGFPLHRARRVEFGDDVVLAVRPQFLKELLDLLHAQSVSVGILLEFLLLGIPSLEHELLAWIHHLAFHRCLDCVGVLGEEG